MQFLEQSNHRLKQTDQRLYCEVWEISLDRLAGNLPWIEEYQFKHPFFFATSFWYQRVFTTRTSKPWKSIESQIGIKFPSHIIAVFLLPNQFTNVVGRTRKETDSEGFEWYKINKSKLPRIFKMDRKTLYSKFGKIWLELIFWNVDHRKNEW